VEMFRSGASAILGAVVRVAGKTLVEAHEGEKYPFRD